jgi:hypothetical protein
MKTTCIPKKTKLVPTYPKLMQGESGVVVLFTKANTGVVVSSTHLSYKVGHFSSDWYTSGFKDYTGKVTLENS